MSLSGSMFVVIGNLKVTKSAAKKHDKCMYVVTCCLRDSLWFAPEQRKISLSSRCART